MAIFLYFIALGETLHTPILADCKLTGLLLGNECFGWYDIALPPAERPSASSVANEHGRRGLGRSAALLPVLSDGCRLGFGSDLAAEAAQLLCCFVLHGVVCG